MAFVGKFGRLEGEDALRTRKQLPRKIVDYDLGDLIPATHAPPKPYVSFFSEAFEELACSRNSVGGLILHSFWDSSSLSAGFGAYRALGFWILMSEVIIRPEPCEIAYHLL